MSVAATVGQTGAMTETPMPLTTTDASTQLLEREETQTGEPSMAHIVKTAPGESATAKVLEARLEGTPIEALCGHVWVPSRDPRTLPLCGQCKEIYEMFRMFNDGLNERPED